MIAPFTEFMRSYEQAQHPHLEAAERKVIVEAAADVFFCRVHDVDFGKIVHRLLEKVRGEATPQTTRKGARPSAHGRAG